MLIPARLNLLVTLRRTVPCSVYALAKTAERNYSNVHTDMSRLEGLGLVERAEDGAVSVPFESVELHVPLGQIA
jgi:predicted transcriptional regulator